MVCGLFLPPFHLCSAFPVTISNSFNVRHSRRAAPFPPALFNDPGTAKPSPNLSNSACSCCSSSRSSVSFQALSDRPLRTDSPGVKSHFVSAVSRQLFLHFSLWAQASRGKPTGDSIILGAL
ncbi:hypothetical protein B0H10DRAFT_327889 [Mycena sp. CBHHK59/15]|nr:hypothetical protein B0H10DRAFT_327889 [Mycena sp. CBHHK59/15]